MSLMTPDECHQRAREAKRFAAETQDLWEREIVLFKIVDQRQLLATHRTAAKKSQIPQKLVVVRKPPPD
jgi:hypothetical protein